MSTLTELQTMDNYEFEHFVAELWEARGFSTTVSQSSRDAGIDVRAIKHDQQEKHLIQAKRYGPNSVVRGPQIQQYAALQLQEPGVTEVHVVTSGRFTKDAKKRARELNVQLTNGEELVRLARRLGVNNDATGLTEDEGGDEIGSATIVAGLLLLAAVAVGGLLLLVLASVALSIVVFGLERLFVGVFGPLGLFASQTLDGTIEVVLSLIGSVVLLIIMLWIAPERFEDYVATVITAVLIVVGPIYVIGGIGGLINAVPVWNVNVIAASFLAIGVGLVEGTAVLWVVKTS